MTRQLSLAACVLVLAGVPAMATGQTLKLPGRLEFTAGGGVRMGGSDTAILTTMTVGASVNLVPRVAAEVSTDFFGVVKTYQVQARVALMKPKWFPAVFLTAGGIGRYDMRSAPGYTSVGADGARVIYGPSRDNYISGLTRPAVGVGFFLPIGARAAARVDVQYAFNLRLVAAFSISLGRLH